MHLKFKMNSKRAGRFQRNRFNDKKRFKPNSAGDSTNSAVKREFRHYEQLSEKDIGATQYISDVKGFSGIIKARFSDFHVNEIDLDGKICILTDTKIPKLEPDPIDPNTITESPFSQVTTSMWIEIKEMMSDKDSDKVITIDITDVPKEERKTIHLKMKQFYGNKIVASTVTENEKKILKLQRKTKEVNDRGEQWPENVEEYVHFVLYKECMDTLAACYEIAKCVGVKPASFAYAGIKDKRAKTTQWLSARKIPPWKLISRCNRLKNIKIGNIEFKSKALKLGDNKGNFFKIALRNVTEDDSVIKEAIENVEKHGFINYYGLQRFGNDKEVPTYAIGKELLLGNWKEACSLILQIKPSDVPGSDIYAAKKKYEETGNAEEALNCLKKSKNSGVESKLLEGLHKENKNDYVNALENIPRNMRLLYMHSLQSLIWNVIVSKRIEKYGLKPVEGDFVVINGVCIDQELDLDEENNEQGNSHPSSSNNKNEENLTDSVADKDDLKPQIKVLSKSDLEQYSIFDIVLPLPGYDIQYPSYLVEDYKIELEKYGLSIEMPKQKVKTYNLSGNYRKIITKIEDLKWKIMKYNNPTCSLIQSEWEKKNNYNVPEDLEDGQYKAVVLEFSLGCSSYATMVLREIMKVETSTGAHAKLNDYANPEAKKKAIEIVEQKAEEEIEVIGNPSSLLNDLKKMEEFKTSVLNDVMRRKHEVEEHKEAKKLKQSEIT